MAGTTGNHERSTFRRRDYPHPDRGGPLSTTAVAGRTRTWTTCSSLGYLISESILNIGMYMLMMITPTIRPTPIIMIGSMIEVSDWIEASTSSS